MSNILIVGVLPSSLINFRGELIRAMVKKGHHVMVLSEPATAEITEEIRLLNVEHIVYPVQRNGLNPFRDLLTFISLVKIFIKKRPDMVLAYTIKPVIWGGLASFSIKKIRFYALVTGLGYAFQKGGLKRGIINLVVRYLYKMSLSRATSVIFQNPDNRDIFVKNKIVKDKKCRLVNGSGVDISRFRLTPLPKGNLVFICIARLLGDKGLREYVAAARMVKKKYPSVVFRLIGPEDSSPDGIPLSEIEKWHNDNVIEYCGAAKDVRPFIADCHVYVLPSYHEGLPRTVIEAMAMGRAIITTDAPGCRETVIKGKNGYLVPVRDAEALAMTMQYFIDEPENLKKMGCCSRKIAEEKYDVHKVNGFMLREMGLND